MKFLKLAFAAAFAFAYGDAYAFHSGGVAECEGCHSMHNSLENKANVTGLPQFTGARYLLKATDQSGACLNCHESPDTAPSGYHISTAEEMLAPGVPPVEMTPGGDFAWLKKTYNFFVRNSPSVAHGERHGHNIIAADFGYVPDSTLAAAPGGTYPANQLHCTSCHDPHGRYRRTSTSTVTGTPNHTNAAYRVSGAIWNSGSYNNSVAPTATTAVGAYRILGGVGYQPKSVTGSYAFTADVPVAVAPSSYNRMETASNSQTVVAYGRGMSEWCANCHGAMLRTSYTSGVAGQMHPASNTTMLTAAIISNYNTYVRTGAMTGTAATSYSTLAPFEQAGAIGDHTAANYATLQGQALLTGANMPVASGTTNVMCLSCHRAHAAGFESMTRFFRNNEFMTVADAGGNAMYDASATEGKINFGKTVLEQQYAYYGRPASMFGPYARNYCNKCHAKD
jgi:hypothetical protein